MDAAKVIAAAALYDGDPWNLIGHGQENWVIPTQALPMITVPTLAATGSEMNKEAFISNEETKVKSFVQADCLSPKVALVDPELTLTVPKDQTAYGVCDIVTHVTEGKDQLTRALEGIDAFEKFLKSIGCPAPLSVLGIGDELFSQYAEDAVLVVRDEDGNLPGRPALSKEDIITVLESAP